MFKKILIANRGEIACRIINTARGLGIETVAVYSSADSHARHVDEADEAYWIGEAPAVDSYLNIAAIIDCALASGSEAIHPGYGFLSENPAFAQACELAGLVFIGPSVAAMEAMASKQLAKQLLEKTEIPLTPGYHGKDQTEARLLKEACQLGFPVLIKAANGGGGKGMRVVLEQANFASQMKGARREALAYFKDDTLIIEKLLQEPRHIEVQVMADNFGQVVHLFERDCSLQRRHQKIIEEAPAASISQPLRQKITQAACSVAKTIDYRGAGTVEFLVDKDEQFYFMEMNTRLQVEHPVTEMVTGLDLVAWQILIAANQPLPCLQEEIHLKGHAIECRIYAEDPSQDFMPSIGQLSLLREPQGEHLRIDSGVREEDRVSQYYDPMIAKLIAFGNTRSEALQRLSQALKRYVIGGVHTNISFLQAICQHPIFKAGDHRVDFLEKETLVMPEPNVRLAVLMAASFDYLKLIGEAADPLLRHGFAWQMHLKGAWMWRYLIGDQEFEVRVLALTSDSFVLQGLRLPLPHGRGSDLDGCTLRGEIRDHQLFLDDGQTKQVAYFENSEHLTLHLNTGPLVVYRQSYESAQQDNSPTQRLTAPMPATIVALLKNQGDAVQKNDPLMVLEAMKMEHTIHAPRSGILAEFFYKTGEQVLEGAELLRLEES